MNEYVPSQLRPWRPGQAGPKAGPQGPAGAAWAARTGTVTRAVRVTVIGIRPLTRPWPRPARDSEIGSADRTASGPSDSSISNLTRMPPKYLQLFGIISVITSICDYLRLFVFFCIICKYLQLFGL